MGIDVLSIEERKLRKALGNLIICVRQYEVIVDTLYANDKTEHGEKVAKALNGLTMANDKALYFGLGFDFRKDKKGSAANFRNIEKWAAKTTREKP